MSKGIRDQLLDIHNVLVEAYKSKAWEIESGSYFC